MWKIRKPYSLHLLTQSKQVHGLQQDSGKKNSLAQFHTEEKGCHSAQEQEEIEGHITG